MFFRRRTTSDREDAWRKVACLLFDMHSELLSVIEEATDREMDEYDAHIQSVRVILQFGDPHDILGAFPRHRLVEMEERHVAELLSRGLY